ncbi:predicted protein [Naegleria gruberi]|uniref:Predicted protein n=1 Tax=Naegleria gruberi TaxID=5762 RepID=D2V9A8_NAEGR|nr:uncharacterized protein NAEGRDRAFT_65375 [Naegleria gruberi]EFC46559.1 predicted protein [Naegleria gruberi]|eukprot:XP_002679303.1 predicted protein [Naegleria gruberi strain NEG-M]
MLRYGFDPNQKTRKSRQETPLFLLTRNFEATLDENKSKSMLEMIKLLLDFDADPTLSDILLWKPIHMVQEKKIIKMLLKKGELIDSVGGTMQQTPLMLSSRKGNAELVEWLLKNHANPNVSDKNGFFPIHHALGNESVVKLLITIGKQDINRRADNPEGFTPLHFCCERETKGIHGKSNLLIMFNADPNVRSLITNRSAEDVSENHKYLFKLYRSSRKELSLQKPIDSSHEAGNEDNASEDEEETDEVNIIMKEQFNKYMINYNYLDSVNEKRMSISHLIIYDYIE